MFKPLLKKVLKSVGFSHQRIQKLNFFLPLGRRKPFSAPQILVSDTPCIGCSVCSKIREIAPAGTEKIISILTKRRMCHGLKKKNHFACPCVRSFHSARLGTIYFFQIPINRLNKLRFFPKNGA